VACLRCEATPAIGGFPVGLRFPYTDEDRLEVLARPPTGPTIDVALEPVDEPKTAPLQNRRIQIATIVDDHDHRSAAPEGPRLRGEDARDAVDVVRESTFARPERGRAEFTVATIVEA